MIGKKLEEMTAFQLEEAETFVRRFRMACLYFSSPLVLSFIFVDLFFSPENVRQFLSARLLVIPFSIFGYYLTQISVKSKVRHAIPALACALYLGVYHSYLCTLTGFEASGYYAGINLAAIILLGFLPWPRVLIPFVILCSYLPYFLVVFLNPHELNFKYLIPNFAFMFSTGFLCLTSFFVSRTLRWHEFLSREALKTANKKQSVIIEEKTKQGIYLEKLTSQFSPQIVQSVKSGELDLERWSRREIACIFIDIEGSTKRANRIDHFAYSSLLADFFSECVHILLRHNVTVGTYLGDGLLAFTNAPQKDPQFKLNALKACLEIIQIHRKRQIHYQDRWRSEFNIRIGIDSGFSTVGFFPSRTRGTYTALGETVNLAARLCGRAEKNSVCVTRQFIKEMLDQPLDMRVKKWNIYSDIKGFEGEEIGTYLITPGSDLEITIGVCALCGSKMIEEADLGDTVFMKCTSCEYKDLIEKKEFAKKVG